MENRGPKMGSRNWPKSGIFRGLSHFLGHPFFGSSRILSVKRQAMNTPPIRVSGFDCRRGHLSKKGFGIGLGGWGLSTLTKETGVPNPDLSIVTVKSTWGRGPGVPKPLKMTHFRVFLDPFLDPYYITLIF